MKAGSGCCPPLVCWPAKRCGAPDPLLVLAFQLPRIPRIPILGTGSMRQTTSKNDVHRVPLQCAAKNSRRARVAAFCRVTGIYACLLIGAVAMVEFGGLRNLAEQHLNLTTHASSLDKPHVASRQDKTRRIVISETNVLGGNFRTHPTPVHSTKDVLSTPSHSARLVIAEVQVANAGEIVDWEGGCPDWIELWNPGEQPFDATGWYLTDRLDKLQKWRIPTLILAPNERVLVFASGYDFFDEEELHTNFRLSKSGESLHLVRPDKTTVEQTIPLGMPNVVHGVTFGPSATIPKPLAYPTPLAMNAPDAVGFTKAVHCSHASCLFETDFTIQLTCDTPEAVIRYTTDGSIPEESNSEIYRQPLTINRTMVIRARAFGEHRVKSPLMTRSFLNLDELVRQPTAPAGFPEQWHEITADYEMDPRCADTHEDRLKAALAHLPMVSVVADNAAIFGREGIYSNPGNSGRDWEVPAVVELLSHEGETGFQAPCGLRLAGDKSGRVDGKKHSLRVSFRSRYGLSALQHPIFASLKVAGPNRGTGPLRAPAVDLLQNEDVLIGASDGLQSKTSSRFVGVKLGSYGDEENKYLWTIDARGINLVQESTPFPTPRGFVVHSNLSRRASLGGEVWFETPERVSLNDRSGRFGVAAGMTRAQWDAAIRYWESLGYQVSAKPGRTGCSSLVLRGMDDSWVSKHAAVRSRAQYIRDEWVRKTEQEMGRLAARGRFVHVCVNGLYWGLYNLVERPDEEHLAHRLGGKDKSYITLQTRNGKIRSDEAGDELWDEITELAAADLNDPACFAALQAQLHIVDLIDYCLVQMYAGGEDWVLKNGNNMRAYRRKFLNARLRFMHWDADATFASGRKNVRVDAPLPLAGTDKAGAFGHLFQRLMTSAAFRQMFAARVDKWCGEQGVLGAAACQRRYEGLLDEVEPALMAEAARWGDLHFAEPFTPLNHWQQQKQRMRQEWFPHRTSWMLKELASYGLTSDSQASDSQVWDSQRANPQNNL